MEKVKSNIKPIFLLALAVFCAVIWYAVFYFEARQNLLVTFFDVGQGDAILTVWMLYTHSYSKLGSLI